MITYRFLNMSVVALCVVAFLTAPANAKNGKGSSRIAKTYTNDSYHPMTINNVFNYYSNCGDGSFNNFSSSAEGFEFPKGLNLATVIFEDGLVWGCYKSDSLKVGGSTYWHGLQAGRVLSTGTASSLPVADDPGKSEYHLYRVRPDMKPIAGVTDPNSLNAASELSTLQRDEVPLINRYEQGTTAAQLLQQYWDDWNNWPATQGAPYQDVDGNGTYDPTVDIPGVPLAGQTMWHVANDLSVTRTQNLAGSNPIGLEFQRTIWAYNLSGALGSTIFVSNKIINKSGVKLDSMYVAQWSDPDLGDATDDYVGCDITRSLGYVYNGKAVDANFASYNLAPPAAGFDFFQGPIVKSTVASDTAIFDLKYRFGYKNLPMTSFNFFINANATYGDPVNANYNGTIQWYRLMRGLVGSSGAQYINPVTNQPTIFVLSGDPVARTGWYENGTIAPPGDRRIALCSGPFTMAPGDTQEVVVAALAGQGADYLSSITVLKANDDIAQKTYNTLFSFPQPPSSPDLNLIALDGKVELDWGNPVSSAKTESQNDQGYTFQGYNIWQLATNSPNGAKLLATFYSDPNNKVIYDSVYDNTLGAIIYKPVVSGTNEGIVHTFEITKDYITGGPIVNNRPYYFAVTAYNYNPHPVLLNKVLEGALNIRTVTPLASAPGVRYIHQFGDSLAVNHSSGGSDGVVLATIIDPSALTGYSYRVAFETSGGNTTWAITDVTNNKVIASKQSQTPSGGNPPGATTSGFKVAVFGPPPGMKGFLIPSGTRRFSPIGGWAGLGLEGFSSAGDPTAYDATGAAGTIGMAGHFAFGAVGTTLTSPTQYHTVLLKLAAVDTGALWNPLVAPADANYSLAYRYLRHAGPAVEPSFAPWIINTVGTYPYQAFNYSVPFSAWDMETTPPTRLAVGMFENNAAGASVDGRYWPPLTSGDNTVNREFCFIFNKPYSTTPDPALQIDFYNQSSTPLMWVMTCTRRNAAPWAAGDQFEITANHVNTASDIFTFTADAPVSSPASAKDDVSKINVFPNPYFGFNKLESDNYNRFVTFTHLPQKATIRVYNLAGILVRTVMKADNFQTIQWDLRNEFGLPVAAGMYLVYIDLPGVGSTKILKLAIIPEQEFLHHY